jgi:hypothetical protein
MTPRPMPPKCDNPDCDETRHIEVGGVIYRCTCHPLAARVTLLEELERARAEVIRLEAAIAAEPAPEWVRGPGVRP